jgi:hypothetical protein
MYILTDYDAGNNTMLALVPVDENYTKIAQDMGFNPKSEFHITAIGYKAANIITYTPEGLPTQNISDLYCDATDEFHDTMRKEKWVSMPKDCQLRIIAKRYGDITRKSLVCMLPSDEPAVKIITKFHHKMEALFPYVKQHLPIPHITIGVDGDHPGIGLTPHVWDNELTINHQINL